MVNTTLPVKVCCFVNNVVMSYFGYVQALVSLLGLLLIRHSCVNQDRALTLLCSVMALLTVQVEMMKRLFFVKVCLAIIMMVTKQHHFVNRNNAFMSTRQI